MGPVVKGVKTSDVINILNDAVEKDQDCFIILGLQVGTLGYATRKYDSGKW